MKILVTGGAGFIGSNFIRRRLQEYSHDSVVNFDCLTYAGNLNNLTDVADPFGPFGDRYTFVRGDITYISTVESVFAKHKPDVVVHFAAESHNSWAIKNPSKFFWVNAMGTQTLLEVARHNSIDLFLHISTCEVYGDLALDSKRAFREESPLQPRTPYNASKAMADLAVLAYYHTFGLPVIISRSANNYGPFQFPEKVIPSFTTNALEGKPLTLYKQSQNRREWVHVFDYCRAINLMIKKGRIGEIYNVGTGVEKSIEQIADAILEILGLSQSMKRYVPDRPSHDRRYLLDSSKIRGLGWGPLTGFSEGLAETITWYVNSRSWWKPLKERNKLREDKW